jgi:tRNA (guanine-N7-)-methyltransferase
MVAGPIDERFLLHGDDLSGPFDFPRLFGRQCPVEIEIGVGRGRFILGEAARCPQVGFLGIERVRKYLRVALERLNRSGCENVRLVREDAGFVVRELILDRSVTTYHIYFPDPWPKRRHHKRRLLNPDFAAHLHRTLCPGGTLNVATDYISYFHEILAALHSVDGWVHTKVWTEQARGPESLDATTYEIKYSREARTIYRLAYIAASADIPNHPLDGTGRGWPRASPGPSTI